MLLIFLKNTARFDVLCNISSNILLFWLLLWHIVVKRVLQTSCYTYINMQVLYIKKSSWHFWFRILINNTRNNKNFTRTYNRLFSSLSFWHWSLSLLLNFFFLIFPLNSRKIYIYTKIYTQWKTPGYSTLHSTTY